VLRQLHVRVRFPPTHGPYDDQLDQITVGCGITHLAYSSSTPWHTAGFGLRQLHVRLRFPPTHGPYEDQLDQITVGCGITT
jgi:hypothetical protein